MYELLKKIFPICRSITGNGVRETLAILKQECPLLKIYEIPSGTKVFDWTVPKEWNIKDGWIKNSSGQKILQHVYDVNKKSMDFDDYFPEWKLLIDLLNKN